MSDCPELIDYDEAFARVCAAIRPLGSENVALTLAAGRFLACPVVAAVDAPPIDASAMDGYAVCGEHPAYRVVGASYPGDAFAGELGSGESVRIFTGAAVPRGAGRIVVQEVAVRDGDTLRTVGAPGEARHIRARGSDFARGHVLLQAGDRLTDRALILVAGADFDRVSVGRKPRVAILATGNELVPAGTARDRPGTIPESISHGLAALLERHGAGCLPAVVAPDDPEAIARAALFALADADVLVMTGGASVGEKDYAKSALAALGLALSFEKIAMKPGKPAWFGHVEDKPVMGLPGNPTSAYITARLLLAPLVTGMAGGRPSEAVSWSEASLDADLPACGDRETFHRGCWRGNRVVKVRNADSSAQLALASAELIIRQPAGLTARMAGESLQILTL